MHSKPSLHFMAAVAAMLIPVASTPAQDECASAIPIFAGVNGPFSNATATASTVSSIMTCGNGSWDKDIWLQYSAAGAGVVTIDTCATAGGDSVMEVYSGACGNLIPVGCSDDFCDLRSSISFSVFASVYYVRLDTFGTTAEPPGGFTVTVTYCASAPLEDECVGATPLTYGLNAGLSNTCCSPSQPPMPCTGLVMDEWWTFTATCTAPHTFSTCTSTVDTVLEVLDDCNSLTSLGCNDDFCGLQSSVTVNLTAGNTYLVRAGLWGGITGTFDINVETGTGAGTQSLHTASTCAAGLSLAITGSLNIGNPMVMTVSGWSGLPLTAYGFLPNHTLTSCGCQIISGGDGQAGTMTYFLGPTTTLGIPCDVSMIGLQGTVQGFDLFFAPSGPCDVASVIWLNATDIHLVTLG